jgi:prevent-host-death family protein
MATVANGQKRRKIMPSHTVKEAKNNLSSLIRLAEKGEPQVIRRHDTEVAVVVSIEDWKKMSGEKESLVEFLRKSPLDEIIPYLERRDDPVREVSFE